MNPINKHRKQKKSLSGTFSKRSNTNDYKQQQKMNLKEKYGSWKQQKISIRNYKYRSDKRKQSTTTEFKKRKCDLSNEQKSTRKYWLTQSIKILGRNHENFIQLRRTIEVTIGFQFNPAGNVINLSAKTFNRDVFKFLNKNLNFVSMQKIILTKRNFIMK